MKKFFVFALAALLLFPAAAPALACHGEGPRASGWYVREEGVLRAQVVDGDGRVLEELPEINQVCPGCRSGVCSAADLQLLGGTAHSLVGSILSPVYFRLCRIR